MLTKQERGLKIPDTLEGPVGRDDASKNGDGPQTAIGGSGAERAERLARSYGLDDLPALALGHRAAVGKLGWD